MKPLLIVDGYNIIGAWREAETAKWSMAESRDRLLHLLQDLSGYTGEEIILVFDGYQSERRVRTEESFGGVTQVYTKHGETADSYIERRVAQTPKYREVRVATSDGLEQSQILSTGATRLTAPERLREISQLRREGLQAHKSKASLQRHPLMASLDPDQLEELERFRRG